MKNNEYSKTGFSYELGAVKQCSLEIIHESIDDDMVDMDFLNFPAYTM